MTYQTCLKRRDAILLHVLGRERNNDGRSYKKRRLKSAFAQLQTLSRFFHLVQFVLRLYRNSGEEKESRCIVISPSTEGHFQVIVMQLHGSVKSRRAHPSPGICHFVLKSWKCPTVGPGVHIKPHGGA